MHSKFIYNEGVKVKSILFFIYFFISIAALCALLIFAPSLKSEDNSNFEIVYTEQNNDITNDVKKENNQDIQNDNKDESEGDSEGNTSENLFATNITLNLPKTITVYVDSELILDSEGVTIQPKEMKDLIKIDILPVYNSDVDKVQRDNLVFKFVGSGTYKLNFSVPAKSGTLEKNVKLVVKDKNNAKIQQIDSTLFLNQNIEVNQIFKSDDLSNFQFKSNDFVIENQIITPQHETNNAVIYAYEKVGCYLIVYKFNFVVKQLPEYKIEFEGVNETVSVDYKNNRYLTLYYVVTNREDVKVPQLVIAEIDNQEIANVESIDVNVESIRV